METLTSITLIGTSSNYLRRNKMSRALWIDVAGTPLKLLTNGKVYNQAQYILCRAYSSGRADDCRRSLCQSGRSTSTVYSEEEQTKLAWTKLASGHSSRLGYVASKH